MEIILVMYMMTAMPDGGKTIDWKIIERYEKKEECLQAKYSLDSMHDKNTTYRCLIRSVK